MSRDLIIRDLTPQVWSLISTMAPAIHQSWLFGVSSPEQAMAIMLTGYELGFGLMASFRVIHIIEGKPSISPAGALALIKSSGLLAEIKIDDQPGRCTVWMRRTDGTEYTSTFTHDDAARAGLIKADKPGSNWHRWEPNMLRARAIGFCSDVMFPDLLAGLKRSDEFGAAIDSDGNVVENQWASAEPAAQPAPAALATPAPITLDDLLAKYDAEAIVSNNEGRIPASDEELAAVAAKLAANG